MLRKNMAEEDEETLFWILYKILETICVSSIVHQCNIAFSAVHVQVCFNSFYLLLNFFLSGLTVADSTKRVSATGSGTAEQGIRGGGGTCPPNIFKIMKS